MSFILRFIFAFQKLWQFDNLLLEKPGNGFAIAKMCEEHMKKKENLSKATCIFTENVTHQLEFSDSAGASQPPGFSVYGISAPNGLI